MLGEKLLALRSKISAIFGLTLACLVAALYITSHIFLLDTFVEQERMRYVYFLASLLAVSLAFGGVPLLLLEKAVLSRLERLSTRVSQLSASNDPSARISMTGKDELSSVAGAINEMLEALERSQRELCESKERLRTVVQNMPVMMVAHDENGNIIAWNQECERVTGYSAGEMVENPQAMELLWPDSAYRNRMITEWFAHRYDCRDWEWEITCQDGSVRTVTWYDISRQFPIPGWEAWAIGVDVSERVQAQTELKQRLVEQETLFAIGRLISSSLQVDEVMQLVAEYMARLMDAACCVISDWDPQAATLTVRASWVRPGQVGLDSLTDDIGQPYPLSSRRVAAKAIRSRKPFVAYENSPELDLQDRQCLMLHHWSGVAGIPIVVLERVIGLAEVYLAQDARPFTHHDLRLLQSLVDQVAVAINNARLFSVVQDNEAAMRDLSLRLINAQEQERRRVAQELHDELGQLLTALKITVDLARRRLPDEATLLRQRMDEAIALTDTVLTNVRTITVDLRPTLLDDMGIVPTLRWYLKRFAQRTGIQVQLEAPELSRRLQPEIETTIYRGALEALTNVARHAQASQVQVRLACSGGTVTVSIKDDGRGFDVEAWSRRQDEQPTLGLAGIQERVMLLNGHVTIEAPPGEGTRIEIALPAQFQA